MIWLCQISEFQGEYRFLSAKRGEIRHAASPGIAKKIGKTVAVRPDWDSFKLDIMRILVRQKFAIEPLRSKLLNTGNKELIEGNHWNDT